MAGLFLSQLNKNNQGITLIDNNRSEEWVNISFFPLVMPNPKTLELESTHTHRHTRTGPWGITHQKYLTYVCNSWKTRLWLVWLCLTLDCVATVSSSGYSNSHAFAVRLMDLTGFTHSLTPHLCVVTLKFISRWKSSRWEFICDASLVLLKPHSYI